jgi:uncharacterized protein (DUF1015 family)
MQLSAFQGLRFAVGGEAAGELAAPPYDQINEAARERFHAANPHQFVHLSCPVAAPPDDAYHHAAALHRGWLASGVIVRETSPALYPYVIDLAGGGQRLGVAALVAYADKTVIRPHEQTLDKPFADRLALLEATRIDLEPVLLLAEDGGALDRLVAADLKEPLVDHRDQDGHHHRLYRITAPERIHAYQALLAPLPAAIADGHHRYKVGQRFASQHGAGPTTAAGCKLAIVSSLASPALTIDPIHRALRTAPEAANLARLTALAATRTPLAMTSGAAIAAAVAAAPQPALGVWVHGNQPELWHLRTAADPPPLVVELLEHGVLPALDLPASAATDGTIVYRSNPAELAAQVARGELALGLFLPPMRSAEFGRAIARGDLLPPKSTRFLPKVMSGLVWADHASRLL